MTVSIKQTGENKLTSKVKRSMDIIMSNGDVFSIREDIEGFMEITKKYSDEAVTICIRPRVSNQITIT